MPALFLLLAFTAARAQPPVPQLPPEQPAVQQLPQGIRWSVLIGAAPSSAPTISGDRVFLSSLPGVVLAHDLKDGREVWREPINPEQPIVVEGPHVFIASGEEVKALQVADGAVAWRRSTGIITAPLVVKEGWVIAASESRMLALRSSDGSIVWEREAALQRQRGAIDGNTLFVPLANGKVQAVDLADGKVRWERPLGGSPAEPLVVGDRVYVGATDKYFYCLDASNGNFKWRPIRVGSSIRGRASTDGERIFFAGLDNLIRAHSRGSGSQRWQRGVPFRPFAGPLVAGGSVFIAGPVNEVRLLSVVTGLDTGKITFPEPLVTAPAVGTAGGEVVVAVITGGLNESWKLWLASPVAPKLTGTPQPLPPVLPGRR